MICHLCKENKLSKEFPFDPLTENCDHPILHCLRCATKSVKNHQKCSQCGNIVSEKSEKYLQYIEALEFLFPTLDTEDPAEQISGATSVTIHSAALSGSRIVVTTLSGECTTLSYHPHKTILNLKVEIEKDLKTPCNKQCLLYNETELKTTNQYDKLSTLKDYNVPPNCTIHLIILLYAVPEGMDHVIFDLFWGYPNKGRDYLDATVFLYSGSQCIEVVDYENTESQICSAIKHSGDIMDDYRRLGHHTIDVSIKSIPAHIDKVVFTLSAYNSPNLSKYRNPSLQFFDANFPNKHLCGDEMSHAARCPSIVMCSLSYKDGQWQVISLKSRASGCAKNYSPLKIKILSLIRKGYI